MRGGEQFNVCVHGYHDEKPRRGPARALRQARDETTCEGLDRYARAAAQVVIGQVIRDLTCSPLSYCLNARTQTESQHPVAPGRCCRAHACTEQLHDRSRLVAASLGYKNARPEADNARPGIRRTPQFGRVPKLAMDELPLVSSRKLPEFLSGLRIFAR